MVASGDIGSGAGSGAEAARSEPERRGPLSEAQLSIWLDEQADSSSIAYNISTAVRLWTDRDTRPLRDVVQRLVDGHSVLRTSFHDLDGEPFRVVHDDVEADLQVVGAAGWTDADVDRFLHDDRLRAFDLSTAPLCRFRLLDRGGGEYVLTIAIHHIVGDLWTMALLGSELADSFGALVEGTHLEVGVDDGYGSFVDAERSFVSNPKGDRASEFWRRSYESLMPLELPGLRARPAVFTGEGAVHAVEVPPALWGALRERAGELGVAPRTFVLASFQALLRRMTGASDTHLLEIKANRNARQSRSFGCFVNPVLRTARFGPSTTIGELVESVHDEMVASRVFERYPFGRIVRETLAGGREGYFDAAFAWQKTTRSIDRDMVSALVVGGDGDRISIGGIAIAPYEMGLRAAPAPMMLIGAVLGDSLELAFEYQTERFDGETIAAFAERLLVVLERVVDAPDEAVDSIDVVLPSEWAAWHSEWEAADRWSGALPTVLEMFDRHVVDTPDSVAVSCGGAAVSYLELDRRADQIAGMLAGGGVQYGDVIGLCLDRSVDMVATMLATWRVGAAYVPIDPSFPHERVAAMIDDSALELVVANPSSWERLAGGSWHQEVRLIDPDHEGAGASIAEGFASRSVPEGSDAAYVIFTSGSTGRPKGVVVEHHSVSNLLASMAEEPGLTHDDIMMATTTLSFDISLLELMLPLTVGAEVRLLTREEAQDPQALVAALDAVTVAQGTPTLWRMLIAWGWAGSGDLVLLCGGEPLPSDLAEELMPRCSALWNMYGPTETTVWSAVHAVERVDSSVASVCLGHPIAGTRLYVLDERRRPVPNGVAGELWIGGEGVARGYVGQPELTAERFVTDPFVDDQRMYLTGDLARRSVDGSLTYEGRVDDQIKLRGHRVELGEIESSLARDPDVGAAVATVHRFGDDDVRLYGYVVATSPSVQLDIEELRHQLRQRLPDYMVPAGIVQLARLPLTPNQKIDRKQLPVPQRSRVQADRSALSTCDAAVIDGLLSICRRVFADDGITIDDDFFALGGHSLSATRIVARLRSELGRDVPMRALYERPALADFASLVATCPQAVPLEPGELGDDPASRGAASDGSLPLSPSQQRMWFIQQLDPVSTSYNLVGAIRVRGSLDPGAVDAVVRELVQRHPGLGSRVVLEDAGPRLLIDDRVPTSVPLIDMRDATDEQSGGQLAAVESAIRELSDRRFDLSRAPLFRFVCYRLADDDHVVGVVIHHLLVDQWSLGVLVGEFGAIYRDVVVGVEGDRGLREADADDVYGDADDAKSRHLEDQLGFWREQLRELPEIELPTDRPRAGWTSDRGGTVAVPLPDDLVRRVRETVVSQQVSEFMVYLAALQLLVHRITGDTDVPIGVPVANRRELRREGLVTSLVNTLIMRTDLAGASDLGEVLDRVRTVALDAYAHQDLSFERLVDDLRPKREGRRTPLFQIFLNVQNAPFELPDIEGLELEVLPIAREVAQFELAISVDPYATRRITVEYSAELFDDARVRGWLDEYISLVVAFAEPSTPVDIGGFPSRPGLPARSHPAAAPVVANATVEPALTQIERDLIDIWEEVLGVAPIGRDGHFFELGGHSLLAARIFAEVGRRTGRRVPMTTLFEAPTVAELARVIDAGGWLRPWTAMVQIRHGESGIPFFYVSPYLITALSFHDLGEELGSDRPFYVFQPQGLEGDAQVHEDIEAMAAHYLAEMRTVQPIGPYVLGGHCAGGWVAFEMARQLQASGEQVERLIIVDVEPPGVEPPPINRLQYVLSRVALYVGSGRLLDAVRWKLRLSISGAARRLGDSDRRRLERLRRTHREAFGRYRGGCLDGDLVFVRSEEWARLADKDWHLAWADLVTGALEVSVVPGAHSGLLTGTSVPELGERLRQALEGSQHLR